MNAFGDQWTKMYLMPRSCAEARSADPSLKSGNYYVDPDGTNVGDDPIYVYCDMSTGKHNMNLSFDCRWYVKTRYALMLALSVIYKSNKRCDDG